MFPRAVAGGSHGISNCIPEWLERRWQARSAQCLQLPLSLPIYTEPELELEYCLFWHTKASLCRLHSRLLEMPEKLAWLPLLIKLRAMWPVKESSFMIWSTAGCLGKIQQEALLPWKQSSGNKPPPNLVFLQVASNKNINILNTWQDRNTSLLTDFKRQQIGVQNVSYKAVTKPT